MKFLLNIQENKVPFFLELIENLSFIEIEKFQETENNPEDILIKEELMQAINELKEIKAGRLSGIDIKNLLK